MQVAGSKKENIVLSGLKHITVSLTLGANLMSLVLLWACCASTYASPASHPRVAVIGLIFPILLFVNFLFIPFWLLFKTRITLVPIIGMALCGSFILDYLPVSFGSTEAKDGDITVMTWNLGGARDKEHKQEAIDYITSCNADIICIEEVSASWLHQQLDDSMRKLGYHYDNINSRYLYSRYPIVGKRKVNVESKTTNGIARFALQIGEDTMRVFVCHLESIGLTLDEKTEYKETLREGEQDALKREMKYLFNRMAHPARFRGKQIDNLKQEVDELNLQGKRVMVIGDFNETPISYAYQQIDKRLNNAFRDAGNGLGISYNQHGFPVRIDHIFYSQHWEAVQCQVCDTVGASDHNPVIARLRERNLD